MPAQTCLCLLLRESAPGRREVLLGRKLRGFGQGRIVGLGGHVEAGETPAGAAVREAAEEAGVDVEAAALRPGALLRFRFPARPAWDMDVHVFVATRWRGDPAASDEVAPAWYPVDALPLEGMWDDAAYWLGRVLGGERLAAAITYDDACERVAQADVRALGAEAGTA
jgi:8-oxo-dGTP diphosphatase